MLACEIVCFCELTTSSGKEKHIPVLLNELDDVDCDLIEILTKGSDILNFYL